VLQRRHLREAESVQQDVGTVGRKSAPDAACRPRHQRYLARLHGGFLHEGPGGGSVVGFVLERVRERSRFSDVSVRIALREDHRGPHGVVDFASYLACLRPTDASCATKVGLNDQAVKRCDEKYVDATQSVVAMDDG
jgi:hypothetical protein